MGSSGVEAVDRKQKIRDRYKGVDASELEVIAKPDKRKSRKMSCKPFAELVYKEMDWDSECRYKVLGYRITFEGETLYVFDLLVPEIFHERQKRKEETVAEQPADQETKPVDTRKGFYPDDIAGTFGVPVEEHLRESEVR